VTKRENREDMPLALALLILSAVVGFLFFGNEIISGDIPVSAIENFFSRNQTVIVLSGILFVLNIYWIIGGLQRWIGFRKQGSRLQNLKGKHPWITRMWIIKTSIGLIAVSITFLILHHFKVGGLKWL
jgi:DNA integrity scanning protein DisA with diadenylate cyclase activity